MQIRDKRSVPDAIWSAFASAIVILVPGVVAVVSSSVLLFPSLGPTAVMMAHSPASPASRPYSAIVAHCIGLGTAFVAVALFHLASTPSVFEVHHVSPARVAAAVVALALAASLEILLNAAHPPAASTTLLAALGSFHPTAHDTLLVVVGVGLTVAAGEPLRRYRLSRA